MDDIKLELSRAPENPGRGLLKVAGPATVAEAALLKGALVDALAEAGEVEVDLAGVTRVDLTALQLLCAAHRSAEKAGKRFSINDDGSELFRTTVAEAGFKRQAGCAYDTTGSCIWIEGDN